MVFAINNRRSTIYAIIGIIVITAIILLLMGRTPFGPLGEPGLWSSNVQSQFNSQRLFDAYTFTHISHGLGFYLLLWFLFPRMSLLKRLILAVGLESIWEIVENTDFVIQRYRETTISLNYYGDSVLNTIGDILTTIIGFIVAGKVSPYWSVALFIGLEVLLFILIRDNLTLNIITLLFPLPAIIHWQQGG
jgi:hypothetical protein